MGLKQTKIVIYAALIVCRMSSHSYYVHSIWMLIIITGFGVVAKQCIPAHTFLFEYDGDLISGEEGEKTLSRESGPGFLFFFGKDSSKW